MIRVTDSAVPAMTKAGKAIVGGTSLSTAGGFWAFLGTHHQEIGALCAMVGAACAVLGLAFSLWRSKNH